MQMPICFKLKSTDENGWEMVSSRNGHWPNIHRSLIPRTNSIHLHIVCKERVRQKHKKQFTNSREIHHAALENYLAKLLYFY